MGFIEDIIKIKYCEEGYLPNYPYHLISDEELFNAFIEVNQRFVGDNETFEFSLDPICESVSQVTVDGVIRNEGWRYEFEYIENGQLRRLNYYNPMQKPVASYVVFDEGHQPGQNVELCVYTGNRIDGADYFHTNYPKLEVINSLAYDNLEHYIRNCITTKVDDRPHNDADIYQIPEWIYSYMLGEVINSHSEQKDVHDLLVLLGMDNIDDEFTGTIYTSIYRESEEWLQKTFSDEERPATMFGEPHVIKSLRLKQEI